MNNTLVAYFSTSGRTSNAAKKISQYLKADSFEIIPVKPYTVADLNWNDSNSRTTIEGKNPSIRPEIQTQIEMKQYDTIYLGYPIWWYRAPNIINTFLESYDFSNKKVILFATSGGSGFEKSVDHLLSSVSDTTVLKEGKLVRSKITNEEIEELIKKGNE